MSIESLKSFFDIATVVLLGLTFFAGAGVLYTGNIINNRQAKQLKQFDVDITSAKSDLARQQERAANAEAKIAQAEQVSKEAGAKAEGFRLDIAKADERTNEAEARAVEASTKAEEFRLAIAKANEGAAQAQAQVAGATAEAAKANLELARIKLPRSLNSAQQTSVAASLSRFAGTEFSFIVFGDPESQSLMSDLDSTLKLAGWKRVFAPATFSSDIQYSFPGWMVPQANDTGLKISFPPDIPAMQEIVIAAANAVSVAGVPCEPHFSDRLKGTKIIMVSVGQKRL